MKEPSIGIEDHILLDMLLAEMNYSQIPVWHKTKELFRLKIEAPRKIVGSEEGRFYANNGYTCILWTSFVLSEEKYRDVGTDVGWPIIVSNDTLVYSATPVPRVPGFVEKMASYAWINKWKIDHLPWCPLCNARMRIFRRSGTRQYCYVCKKSTMHPTGKFEFLPWDYGLPPRAQEFLDLQRMARKVYRDRNQREGKHPTPKALLRKRWIINAPENRIDPVE